MSKRWHRFCHFLRVKDVTGWWRKIQFFISYGRQKMTQDDKGWVNLMSLLMSKVWHKITSNKPFPISLHRMPWEDKRQFTIMVSPERTQDYTRWHRNAKNKRLYIKIEWQKITPVSMSKYGLRITKDDIRFANSSEIWWK